MFSPRQAGQKISPQPEQRTPVISGSNLCPQSEQHHSPDCIVKRFVPNICHLPECPSRHGATVSGCSNTRRRFAITPSIPRSPRLASSVARPVTGRASLTPKRGRPSHFPAMAPLCISPLRPKFEWVMRRRWMVPQARSRAGETRPQSISGTPPCAFLLS